MKDNLKALRRSRSLTQNQIAKDFDITQATNARLEKGLIQLKPERIEKFAKYFNVDIEQIKDKPLGSNDSGLDSFTKEYIEQIVQENRQLRLGRLRHLGEEVVFLRKQNIELQDKLVSMQLSVQR